MRSAGVGVRESTIPLSEDEKWKLHLKLSWNIPKKVPSRCRVELMDTLDFLSRVPSPCRESFTAFEDMDKAGCWNRSSFEHLINQIKQGKKLDIPYLDYGRMFRGFPTHEGRHRARLAWELYEREIPVLVCDHERGDLLPPLK